MSDAEAEEVNPRRAGRRIGPRLVTAIWLFALWVFVSGSYTTASLFSGVVAVALVMVVFRRTTPDGPIHRIRPLMLIRYFTHFAGELVKANVEVARAVISPKRVENTRGVIEVPLPKSSRLVGAVLANAVSLTPGTSIIEVHEDPPSFHVHVLHLESVDEVRSSIAELHVRLVRALGPVECLDEVERFAAELRTTVKSRKS